MFKDVLLVFKILSVVINLLFEIRDYCFVTLYRFFTFGMISLFWKNITTNSSISGVSWLGIVPGNKT